MESVYPKDNFTSSFKLMIMKVTLLLFFILITMDVGAQKNVLIKNGNATLNTTIYAGDKRETVILLHGGPGVPDDMIEVVNVLKDKYRVVNFEQRGVGLSKCNKCNFTMADYHSDINTIAKYLNIKEFHLFGHSWGGLYAQIYAAEEPENIKSLFLCSPGPGTNKTWKKSQKEVLDFNKKITSTGEWISMGWNSILGKMGSDKAYGKLFKQALKNYHKNYIEITIEEAFLNKIHAKPINKTLKEIINYKPLTTFTNPDFPIIITYGDNDIYGASKKELIKRYPTSDVEVVENCGHMPWKHNPEAFELILNKFYTSQVQETTTNSQYK